MRNKQSNIQVEPCRHALLWAVVVAGALAMFSCTPETARAAEPAGVSLRSVAVSSVEVCDTMSDIARSTFIVVGIGFDVKGSDKVHAGIMQMVLNAVRAGATTPDKVGAHVYNVCMKDRV